VWIPRTEWSEEDRGQKRIGEPGWDTAWGEAGVEVCPGSILVHPFIKQVVMAKEAMGGGAWADVVTCATPALLEGVFILKGAFNLDEKRRLRKPSTPPQAPLVSTLPNFPRR
jgi:hypothetical protein